MKGVPNWIEIPAGTPARTCSGATCAAIVYWIVTKKGKRQPVSIAAMGAVAPTNSKAGRGIAHHADCSDASAFRGR